MESRLTKITGFHPKLSQNIFPESKCFLQGSFRWLLLNSMFSLLLAPYPVKDKVPVIYNFVKWFLYDWNIGLNPFSTNAPLLNPLNTPENRRFSDVFRGYRNGTLVDNGLSKLEIVGKFCL